MPVFVNLILEMMEAKLDGISATFKEVARANAEKIDANRKWLYFIMTAILGGAVAILWQVANIR